MAWRDAEWRPYVPVAERRRRAEREAAKRTKAGAPTAPVRIEGRAIAKTVWGKAWCDHLERYCDYENRLPRGRTYVRNGSVIDLVVKPGQAKALVMGSELYRVNIQVGPVSESHLRELQASCAGAVSSVVELLSGRLSDAVMGVFCHPTTGIFPTGAELHMHCSCPDWATMCKHVAASLYGIGARLDASPELLFTLRSVDHLALVAQATAASLVTDAPDAPDALDAFDDDGLAALFGIELDEGAAESPPPAKSARDARRHSGRDSAPDPDSDLASDSDLVSTKQLLADGIPRSTFQNWVTAGDLLRTSKRGVYRMTPRAWERLERYLANQ